MVYQRNQLAWFSRLEIAPQSIIINKSTQILHLRNSASRKIQPNTNLRCLLPLILTSIRLGLGMFAERVRALLLRRRLRRASSWGKLIPLKWPQLRRQPQRRKKRNINRLIHWHSAVIFRNSLLRTRTNQHEARLLLRLSQALWVKSQPRNILQASRFLKD